MSRLQRVDGLTGGVAESQHGMRCDLVRKGWGLRYVRAACLSVATRIAMAAVCAARMQSLHNIGLETLVVAREPATWAVT